MEGRNASKMAVCAAAMLVLFVRGDFNAWHTWTDTTAVEVPTNLAAA
jgi:hypothetical protein